MRSNAESCLVSPVERALEAGASYGLGELRMAVKPWVEGQGGRKKEQPQHWCSYLCTHAPHEHTTTRTVAACTHWGGQPQA